MRVMGPMLRRWFPSVALLGVLAGACGTVSTPLSGSASSVTQTTATATATSTPAATRMLALVTLRGSNSIVVRDITDINHPATVGVLGPYPSPVGGSPAMEGLLGQFISATEFSYAGGTADPNFALPTELFRAPLSGSPNTAAFKGAEALIAFAWSPDGSTLAYITAGGSGSALHQLKAGQDRVLATVPPPGLAGGCEVSPCPGPFQNPGDKWDFRLSYSADGTLISMVQNSITSYLRVWSSDGKVLGSVDGQATTMSVRSGDGLYFRDSNGVEVWRNGAVSTFLPGVAWIRPKASPDGAHIVYEARDAQGSAHVFVVDTGSKQVRDLGKARSEPTFLTSRYIWYQAEPGCVATGNCQAGFPGIAPGSTYIYDLQDNTETASAITAVIDVWPHAA